MYGKQHNIRVSPLSGRSTLTIIITRIPDQKEDGTSSRGTHNFLVDRDYSWFQRC